MSKEREEIKQKIGLILKKEREKRGENTSNVSKNINISRPSIENIEIGKNHTIDNLIDYLDYYNFKLIVVKND